MGRSKNDLWVGLFVLIGLAALVFLALQSANLLSLNFQRGYRITANFDNIGGLKPKAAVRSAGVVVGRVAGIRFDDERCRAAPDLLLEESKSRQILLFTCQHRESAYLSGRDGVTFLSL